MTPSDFSVFKYDSLPALLRDFLTAHRGDSGSKWTMRGWAARLGMKNSGTLSNIVAGRRQPSRELANRILDSMEISESERNYIRILVDRAALQNVEVFDTEALTFPIDFSLKVARHEAFNPESAPYTDLQKYVRAAPLGFPPEAAEKVKAFLERVVKYVEITYGTEK